MDMDSTLLMPYYRSIYFTLDRDNRVHPETFEVWARWMDRNGIRRWVGRTSIADVTVSTYFLGLNISHGRHLELFETVIISDEQKRVSERYEDWSDAYAGHLRWVSWVREQQTKGASIHGSLPGII